ncbi:hypothetical protein F2P81_006251 [Scophthalmus maximus]|uniref:Uncharacterized protein n=1 Tax=Scophthalmus maximus TaxID=52904 RepID=A0A6A4T2R6_SCOMX|nr:hypothetical protein F2P81_006251 [Scophthalmus maximus]
MFSVAAEVLYATTVIAYSGCMCRTLRQTTCHSNRIKANKSYAVSYLFLLVLLVGDVQLNPDPGLVDTPVDGATGLLPRQRVEFPALECAKTWMRCLRTLSTTARAERVRSD